VGSREQLYDVTFDLLGSSTEDLFFPHNYLIVEGASDQVIAERFWRCSATQASGFWPPKESTGCGRALSAWSGR
jgi:hypothetical protein